MTRALSASPPPFINIDAPPIHSSASSSAVIVVIVISSAIILSASIYLLLRFLSRRCRRSPRTFSVAEDVIIHREQLASIDTSAKELINSLPAFTFGSVSGNLTGGDCAVCLSKFERSDQLRLLPLCCHAFHAECVDTWLVANQTCPLCRSTIYPSEEDVLNKILSQSANDRGSGSFRIEIGNISRRIGGAGEDPGDRRSYSVGDFEYIVDDGYQLPMESMTQHRGISDDKEINHAHAPSAPEISQEALAAEVGNGRSLLRDYMDRLSSISSRTISFKGSGRFFGGSSRRSEAATVEDLEEYRAGEEISELFRWLSGI